MDNKSGIWIHQIPRILPLWSLLTRSIYHWKVDILQKIVACLISNMISSHQNSIKYSSKKNSKAALLWTSRTFATMSICASMRILDSDKTFFLLISQSKDTLILKNTFYQVSLTLPILLMQISTLTLYTHCWCR